MTIKDEPGKRTRLPKAPPARESEVAAGQVPAVRPEPPRTIRIAVLFMYAGAALTAAGLALSVIAVATGERALRASHPHATAAQLHATQKVLIIIAIASGVLEIAGWLLLARANRNGLKWARIVATALFALSTLNLAGHLHGAATIGNTIYSVLIWLVGLATIVLLWLRESSQYYASGTARPSASGTARPSARGSAGTGS
ncbi:MAG: hypothetical protein ACR2FU_22550 [Streptosporangiaceae bacterium]